ncbi:hypothetical protein LWC34_17735 [Kibdelosporangium philippinense]|uniref:HPF/RaiA family ribosome-associated protein n=1 Tax=Kibdelosporangium philippinense TaxID=211113 RepID=A0ABS8ZAY4_9PSEU|nr:hypothetical protein [Kibdelosporangium philippinense]MCE7004652.1 hypothetical protein [Kibdelosporangium philippinense]
MRHDRTDQPNVQIELAGSIPADAADYAKDKVLHLVKYARRPILFVKVRLMAAGHGNNKNVVAHANLDVSGTPVISHSVGETTTEAVDLLQDKLRGRLGRM